MKFSQYLEEGIRTKDFESAVSKIKQYLDNHLGKMHAYPEMEHFRNSVSSGVGLRYFLADGRSIRFNWTKTTASAKIDSITLWTGKTKHPNFQITSIGGAPLGDISLAQVLPTLVRVINQPQVGVVEMTTAESAQLLIGELKMLTEQVLTEDPYEDVVNALQMGPVSRHNISKMGRNQERIFNDLLTKYKNSFDIKTDGGGRQKFTLIGDVADFNKDDIVKTVIGGAAKRGRAALEVFAVGAEEVETDGERAAEQQFRGAPQRIPYEEQLEDMRTLINAVVKGASNFLIIGGKGGLGKFLENDAVIYTKQGPTLTHGTVKPGDRVLTPSGRETTVIQTYPHNNVPFYRVTLHDGTSVLAGGPHLWKVWDKTSYWDKEEKQRKTTGRWATLTTEEIMKKGLQKRSKKTSSKGKEIPAEWRFLIPYLPVPVDFEKKHLPVDPYIIGTLIGDGSMSTNNIAITVGSHDQVFMLEQYSKLLPSCKLSPTPDNLTFRLTEDASLRSSLESLGLQGTISGTKFIPSDYLYSSFADRLSLLQGLMDTDGCVEGGGNTFVYYTTSEQLAKDVQTLVLSFGQRAGISSHTHKFTGVAYRGPQDDDRECLCYRVTFSLPDGIVPVRNPRKIAMIDQGVSRRSNVRGKAIVSIEYERHGDGTCIMVDDPEHLYVTDHFITTHNTHTVEETLGELGLQDGAGYFKNTSSGSPSGLYRTLFINRTGIVVLDDSDTIVNTQEGRNLLKAALDTKKKRKLVWAKMAPWLFDPGDDYEMEKALQAIEAGEEPEKFPRYFDFEGRVIMISNLPLDVLDPDGALATRGFVMALNPTTEEVLDFMKKIAPKMKIEGGELSEEERKGVVDLIAKQGGDLNLRKLVRGLNLAAAGVPNFERIIQRYV